MDGIVQAQRKKPRKVLDHIEVYSQRGGGAVILKRFTSPEHDPEPEIITARGKHTPARARSVVYAPNSDAVRVAPQSKDPLARRTQTSGSVADLPVWQRRGLFKPGFTQGPRIKGAKLHTKGKANV